MSTIFWWSSQTSLCCYDSLTTTLRGSLYAVSLSLSLYAVSLCCTVITTLCWSLRLFTTLCFTTLFRSSLIRFGFFVCFLGCPEVPPSSSPHFPLFSLLYFRLWEIARRRLLYFVLLAKSLFLLDFLVGCGAEWGLPCNLLILLDFFEGWTSRHRECIGLRYLQSNANVPGILEFLDCPHSLIVLIVYDHSIQKSTPNVNFFDFFWTVLCYNITPEPSPIGSVYIL